MEDNVTVSGSSNDKPEKSGKIKTMTYLLVALVLIFAGGAYGIYAWQNGEVTDLQANLTSTNDKLKKTNTQLTDAKKDLEEQNQKYTDLEKQYQALVDNQDAPQPTQADLKLTVGEATTYDSGCCHFIGIVVTLENTTKSSISVAPSAYKLKDAENHSFNYAQSTVEQDLGKNYAELKSQVLAPGEKVTGALGYYISDSKVISFTLSIGDQSYKVTSKPL